MGVRRCGVELPCFAVTTAKPEAAHAPSQKVIPSYRRHTPSGNAYSDITDPLTGSRGPAQTKTGFVLKEPKTAASRQTLTLPGFVVDALTTLKAARTKSGLLGGPVFCTRIGEHLCKKNVLRAFRGALEKANAHMTVTPATGQLGQRRHPAGTAKHDDQLKLIPEKVRFHDLRHSVTSLLLSKGHSLKAVSARLRHANPTMTLRVYSHVMPNDDANLADGLARMMT